MAKTRLVLMSCCAPCSCGAIQQLANGDVPDIDDFIVLFYNPNIFPVAEYDKRLAEQIRYCDAHGIKYAIGDYDHDAWRTAVCGHEDAPEQGTRCSICFRHRFDFARAWAIAHGYNAVASVFGVSRHKDQTQVDAAARDALGPVPYLPIAWNEALRQSTARQADFYRQNYCGCEFSIRNV